MLQIDKMVRNLREHLHIIDATEYKISIKMYCVHF